MFRTPYLKKQSSFEKHWSAHVLDFIPSVLGVIKMEECILIHSICIFAGTLFIGVVLAKFDEKSWKIKN